MGRFKTFFSKTLLGKFTKYVSDSIQYRKDYNLIQETFYSAAFKKVLDNYLKTDIKKDWIGRLYGVVNPNISNGKYDFNNVIIEIDGDNTNNNEYVRHWVYKQMQLIAQLFKIEKLYDYIDISFEHVGPQNMDNYLIIFDIVSRKEKVESRKSFFKRLFIDIPIILGALYLTFKLII